MAKLQLLQGYRDREGLDWSSPEAAAGRPAVQRRAAGQGPLQPAGRPWPDRADASTDEEVARAVTEPPDDTRAYFRGRCLSKYAAEVAAASWDSVIFDVGRESLQRVPDARAAARYQGARRGRCSSAADTAAQLVDEITGVATRRRLTGDRLALAMPTARRMRSPTSYGRRQVPSGHRRRTHGGARWRHATTAASSARPAARRAIEEVEDDHGVRRPGTSGELDRRRRRHPRRDRRACSRRTPRSSSGDTCRRAASDEPRRERPAHVARCCDAGDCRLARLSSDDRFSGQR